MPTEADHPAAVEDPVVAHMDAWTYYESMQGVDRSLLPHVPRCVLALCDLRQEVNSGGFDSYLRYGGGNSALDAAQVADAVLGLEWAEVLREVMALFGADYPRDPADRERLLDSIGADETLEELDRRFFDLEANTDADGLMSAYLGDAGT